MPELPEVETVVRGLRKLRGRKIVAVRTRTPRLRVPLNARKLNVAVANNEIKSVTRHAKFIVITLANARILLIHLGMTGSLRMVKFNEPLAKHDHVIFTLDHTQHGEKLVYADPRKFGLVQTFTDLAAFNREYAHLGIEPLSAKFTAKWMYEKTRRAATEIKPYLMKQEIVVGVGNIYASEALHNAKISPTRAAKTLTRAECTALVRCIKEILQRSIKSGGTTISDYRQLDGGAGKFVRQLKIYDREGKKCTRRNCGGVIGKITQAGRSTFYCPQCQK